MQIITMIINVATLMLLVKISRVQDENIKRDKELEELEKEYYTWANDVNEEFFEERFIGREEWEEFVEEIKADGVEKEEELCKN